MIIRYPARPDTVTGEVVHPRGPMPGRNPALRGRDQTSPSGSLHPNGYGRSTGGLHNLYVRDGPVMLRVRTMSTIGFASLAPEQVKKVQRCEEELGVTLLAYKRPTYSELNEENLRRIQALEKELNLSLVAYDV